jgi:hypothetical protein
MGPPDCGLASAAFCESFDAPSKEGGRGGDLDPKLWSASRLAPQGPTDGKLAFPVGAALLPPCREGSPTLALPPNDTLVCDPNPEIRNSHLLVAVASQNYGINSYRIRQPFDFAGRTGKIVFDAQGYQSLGWISLEVTEDPIPAPSYALFVNDEGGIIPKNGFELQFSTTCGQGGVPTVFGLRHLHEFKDYADTVHGREGFDCPSAKKSSLNHFEITVSQQKIEVFITPYSEDGVNFGPTKLHFSANVGLNFNRGYVHISTRNHASLKYSTGEWSGNAGETDLNAWLARWDNVGFDGPILGNTREYEVPDALTPVTLPITDPHNPGNEGVNIGYIVPDAATGPSATLKIKDVDLAKAKSARLSLAAWYPDTGDVTTYVLNYRFNGGTWRQRPMSAGEAGLFKGPVVTGSNGTPGILGAIGQMIDVDLADLTDGENTLEFTTTNVPQNIKAGVANIDLVLTTE